MAITIQEQFNGLSMDDTSAQKIYIIRGTSNEIRAREALNNYVDQEFDGKPLENTGIDEQISNSKWRGWARWSHQTPPDPDYIQYSFDISAGSQHITQSLSTKMIYGSVQNAPSTKGTIGVTLKGDVLGCDIFVPEGAWSETQYFEDKEITTAYKKLLRTMVGSVNNAPFKGDATGESLFIGVSGSRITRPAANPAPREQRYDVFLWEMQFQFATSENHTKAGGNPIIAKLKDGDFEVDKLGWEYIWYLYETTKVAAEGERPAMLLEQAAGCYVEQVYQLKNFSLLNIGTT